MPRETADRTAEILQKVREIEIRTNRLVNDALSGEYQSVFKGRGINFDEVREYYPGDEVRMIDWNVTARTGTPFVKKFSEERELTIMLLVDLSASGDFGSSNQSKRELAAEVASVLAFSAIRNRDKVGLILFTDQIEAFIPPQRGRKHVLRVVREILYFEPEHRGTDLRLPLDLANQLLSRRAVIFLLSDFCMPAQGKMAESSSFENDWEPLRPALRLTNRRHDLVALNIMDRREEELPAVGLLTLEDSETGEQFELDTNSATVRKKFSQLARNRLEAWRRFMHSLGIGTLELTTGQPYITALLHFFEGRGKRRRSHGQ